MCAYLLHELPPGYKEPFIARPSHSTIVVCALLTWLPEVVVKKAIHVFGAQLREELIGMMSRAKLVQDHPLSDFFLLENFEGAAMNKSYQVGGVAL